MLLGSSRLALRVARAVTLAELHFHLAPRHGRRLLTPRGASQRQELISNHLYPLPDGTEARLPM